MSTTETAPAESEALAEAPEEKVQRDFSAELATAYVAASQAITPGDDGPVLPEDQITSVQETYRSIPAAARGGAQADALKAVLTEGNPDGLERILEAIQSLPKPTKGTGTGRGRKPKVEVDPVEAGAKQGAAILVAWAKLGEVEHGAEISAAAQEMYQNGISEDIRDEVLERADKVFKVATKVRGGASAGGTRTVLTESLEDLIGDGRVKTPLMLYGTDDLTAKVLKSGVVKWNDQEFPNLSAAAKAAKQGGDPEKKVSLNGWDFWKIEDPQGGEKRVSIGTLRTK